MSTEYEPYEPRRPQQPGLTRAAGILWIVMGVVFVFFGCLNVVLTAALAAKQPNRSATWLAFGIGAGLFVAGRNLLTGKAKDVLVASILSILLGLFYAVARALQSF